MAFSLRRLKTYRVHYDADPTDAYKIGNYKGIVFENYATNLVVRAAQAVKGVGWVIPLLEPVRGAKKGKKAKKVKKPEKNSIDYDHDGSIVLFREGRPYAEFDALLSIGDRIILVEMKTNRLLTDDILEKLENRAGKLSAAYGVQVQILVLQPHENTSKCFEEKANSCDGFTLLGLNNFLPFWETLDAKTFKPIYLGTLTKCALPSDKFPQQIDYLTHSVAIYKGFLSVDLSPQDFWVNNEISTKIVNKIPVGVLDPSIDLSQYGRDKQSTITKSLVGGVTCVLYLRFSRHEVVPEIVVCKPSKGNHPRFKEFRFSLTAMRFVSSVNSTIRVDSFYYLQAKSFAKEGSSIRIGNANLKGLLERCLELSGRSSPEQVQTNVSIEMPTLDQILTVIQNRLNLSPKRASTKKSKSPKKNRNLPKSLDPVICPNCGMRTKTLVLLSQHIANKHSTPVKAPKSSLRAKKQKKKQKISQATESLLTPQTRKKLKCLKCNQTFINPKSLAQHAAKKHPSYPKENLPSKLNPNGKKRTTLPPKEDTLNRQKFSCPLCKRSFSTTKALAQHTRVKHRALK